jgi:polyisoprenyl-phosphate glycosyltransferase
MPPSEAVSVVVPVFRNAETLDELHTRLAAALAAEQDLELVFVDDACPSGSAEVLERLAGDDDRVHRVRLPANVGQHRAILAGLAQARGEWIVVLDADLQDSPEAVPELLENARAGGADAVFAGRRGRYESLPRHATSRVFKRALQLACGVPSDAGGFVVLSARLARRLVAMGAPPATLAAMIGCAGLPVRSLPVARAPRPRGRSAHGSVDRALIAGRTLVWVASWKVKAARGSG